MGTTTQPTMRTGQLSGVLGWALCLVAVLQLARADNIRDFDHMNGDGAHTRVFQHLDRNNDGIVSFKEGTNFGITKQHLMYYRARATVESHIKSSFLYGASGPCTERLISTVLTPKATCNLSTKSARAWAAST